MALAPRDPGPILDLLDALYGGLLSGQGWEAFLRRLAERHDATFATLILTAPGDAAPGEILTPDVGQDALDNYTDALFATDPFVGLPEGQVVAFAEFLAGRELDAEWRRYLDGPAAGQILGVDVRLASGLEARFRLTRDRSRADFDAGQREALQALVPHLRHAVTLHERLEASAIEHGVYRGAMEQLAVASLILDRKGRILRSNAVADRLLAAADGAQARDGRLVLHDHAVQAELDRLLAQGGEAARLRLRRPSGGRELGLLARAVSAPTYLGEGAPALAVFIADPDQPARPDPEALRDLFQLTRMEAILAAALADGASLIEAAGRLGIAHNTARSHLRAAFAKTGARRQSQLVQLIQASLAGISARDF